MESNTSIILAKHVHSSLTGKACQYDQVIFAPHLKMRSQEEPSKTYIERRRERNFPPFSAAFLFFTLSSYRSFRRGLNSANREQSEGDSSCGPLSLLCALMIVGFISSGKGGDGHDLVVRSQSSRIRSGS